MAEYKTKSNSQERRENEQFASLTHPDELQLKKMVGIQAYTDRQERVNRYMGELDRRTKTENENAEWNRKVNAKRAISRLFTGVW